MRAGARLQRQVAVGGEAHVVGVREPARTAAAARPTAVTVVRKRAVGVRGQRRAREERRVLAQVAREQRDLGAGDRLAVAVEQAAADAGLACRSRACGGRCLPPTVQITASVPVSVALRAVERAAVGRRDREDRVGAAGRRRCRRCRSRARSPSAGRRAATVGAHRLAAEVRARRGLAVVADAVGVRAHLARSPRRRRRRARPGSVTSTSSTRRMPAPSLAVTVTGSEPLRAPAGQQAGGLDGRRVGGGRVVDRDVGAVQDVADARRRRRPSTACRG